MNGQRRWTREKKAWRRIKEDRAQHGVSRTCPCWGEHTPSWGRTFSFFADTPKRCSCYMCGNPRRYFGHLTVHEQRADDNMDDQLAHGDV